LICLSSAVVESKFRKKRSSVAGVTDWSVGKVLGKAGLSIFWQLLIAMTNVIAAKSLKEMFLIFILLVL
jgi:hypothetical protein